MKTINTTTALLALSLTAVFSTGCTSGVSSYGPGSDTGYVKSGRGRPSAVVSVAERENNKRGRAEVLDEMKLEDEKQNQLLRRPIQYIQTFDTILKAGASWGNMFRK